MLRTDDTEAEGMTFQKLRYRCPDERIMRRFEMLRLHSHGKSAPEIADLVERHVRTVREVVKMYKKGGVEPVTKIDSNHPTSELEKHRTSIVEESRERPPATAGEAAARIEKPTGIRRSERRVRKFMEHIGMPFCIKRRKTAAIPAKADLEKRETFKKSVGACNNKRESGRVRVAVHGRRSPRKNKRGVQAAFPGCPWRFERPRTKTVIRSPSGRKRRNVPGAYNAITGELTTVANDGCITATTVCELLRKLSAQDAGRPIVIVLDNARYRHCKLVEGLAKEPGITLEFLPSYSPNLNSIERLWKFVKKKCLYNIYHATFEEFTSGINDCLSRVGADYKSQPATLMQPNFQDFKNVKLLTL